MQQVSRIFLSALLCFCVLTGSFILPAHAQPGVSAEAAILIDADSGRVIWSKNADDRHAMASTTKIMTALVALREMPLDTTVEINPAAVGVEGSSVYLYAGEQLTLEDLLYAMLLESANDAAAAIAIAVSGSIDAFAAEMNACAAELGLETPILPTRMDCGTRNTTPPHGNWHKSPCRHCAIPPSALWSQPIKKPFPSMVMRGFAFCLITTNCSNFTMV
ncbi:MAG: D-alanyl-D-alanine carboxypeptidase [Clostridia bacterium]|nr:D-alanyl-D-alanine carboxypeptidase [Clostridia bacterium]